MSNQLDAGLLTNNSHDPSAVVTRAMAEEISDRGGLKHDALTEAERGRDYPCVAKNGRVIDADTRLVVIDPSLVDRLTRRERVGFRDLLLGSVQIWARKIDAFCLEALPSRQELYRWPYDYDAACLGYMAGVLKQVDIEQSGIAIF